MRQSMFPPTRAHGKSCFLMVELRESVLGMVEALPREGEGCYGT